MRHFSLEEWVDFARGVVNEKRGADMQRHLDTSCEPCLKVMNLWRRVQRIAQREASHEPSADALRYGKQLFAPHKAGAFWPKKVEVAQILLDSFLQPQLAAVRSAEGAVRQLLYGAGQYSVDIRIEPQENSDKVALVGQVLKANDADQGIALVPIVVFRAGKSRTETVTNRFGEFRVECALGGGLELRVSLHDGTELQVPVPEARS